MSNAPDYGALYAKPDLRLETVNLHSFPRHGAYVQVPQDIAEKHPLYGVAGWTIVLAVLMILDAVVYLLAILGSFILAANAARGGGYILLAFIQMGLLAWAIATIVKLFEKHPSFPRQFTLLCIACIALTLIGFLFTGVHWIGVIQLVVAGVYITYVQASRRVRVTYRHQIEVTDPLFDYLPRENVVSGARPAMPAA